MKSALFFFILSVILGIFLGTTIHQAFCLLILLFGLNLPFSLIAIQRDSNKYFDIQRERIIEEYHKEREEYEKRRREYSEAMRKMNEEIKRKQREFEQKARKQAEEYIKQQRVSVADGHLRTLGLPTTCRDIKQIKAAYRSLMKKYHPDINKSPGAGEKSKKIIAAYEYLEKTIG